VIFDVDGVLSDAAARQHLLQAPRRDWDAFFLASGSDPLLEDAATMLRYLDSALVVVLLTARPWRIQELTVGWLESHQVRWDLLVMRRSRDFRAAVQFKEAAVADLRQHGYRPVLSFEDDLRNVEMFRAQGVPTVYIHSGYYD
jgi:phosphoglycolate phosphatase-like HAD superfamily hydrolase